MTTKIPKIIHQTWKTEEIPNELIFCVDSWKHKNPNWRHILWTHEMMDDFVKERFPEVYEFYSGYKFEIFRADLFRLLVLHDMGGVYVDLDMECIKNLDNLFDEHIKDSSLCFSKRPRMFAKMYNVPVYIQNFFIASSPRNKVLKQIIDDVVGRGVDHDVKKVVHITGPLGVTESLNKLSLNKLIKEGSLKILDEKIVGVLVNIAWNKMYFDRGSLKKVRETVHMLLTRKFPPQAHMIHYYHGTYHDNKPMLFLTKEDLLKLKKKLAPNSTYHRIKYKMLDKLDYAIGASGILIHKVSPQSYLYIRKSIKPISDKIFNLFYK
jgi:mannosyltransferase OCH1-like enzyme